MRVPANPAAETIRNLESVNADIDTQIQGLQAAQQRNLSTVASLEPSAEWDEIPDPPVEIPDAPAEGE